MSSLKIIATPIGNVRDITLRAMQELALADVILAEDTRHSLKLLQALAIELKPGCKLLSCDAHKEEQRIAVVIECLRAGARVVLLSDAGSPAISDPGSLLVQGIVAAGLPVEVIPGPSALTASLMGAGIDTTRFAFLGFLPQKKLARKNLILPAAEAGLALVIYESALRVEKLLAELFAYLGNRRVVVARELTKLHETFHRGVLGESLHPPFNPKGECVVVVEAAKKTTTPVEPEEAEAYILAQIQALVSSKDIVLGLMEKFKMKKNSAYSLVLKISKTL